MNTSFIYHITEYSQPNYVINDIKYCVNNWEYQHIKIKNMEEVIKNKYTEEFPSFLENFNSIKQHKDKLEIFKYYILFLSGGIYINTNIKILKNITDIFESYDFVAVQSIVNKNDVFNGFMGSIPKSPIFKEAIIKAFENIDEINNNKYKFNEILFQITTKYKNNNNKIQIFQETICNEYASVIDNNNEPIFRHYYKNKMRFIKSDNIIENRDIKTKNIYDIKIGVTFNCPDKTTSMYSNGINQNTLYFCETLLNIGYDTYLIINDNKNINYDNILKEILYDTRFKTIYLSDIYTFDFDFVVSFGFSTDILATNLRYLKTKIIGYFCGNQYIIDSEQILYNQTKNRDICYDYNEEPLFDIIWTIPQMINTNQHYWETIYRCKCVEIPFIWSYKLIDKISDNNIDKYMYIKRETKKIAIFEPNMSIMKWGLPALFVCENAYRISKNIDKVYLTNAVKNDNLINDFSLKNLNKIVKPLDLFKDKKISIERRYNTLFFMSQYADIVVSHQWENPLNYLYLDLAWMGWPVLHNAHLCKDIGYYYEGFNYEQGGQILSEIIEYHDKNQGEYIKKNRELIDRYLPTNKKLQEEYIKLFEQLFYTF